MSNTDSENMVKRTHSYFSAAVAAGLFLAILTKTGIDVSPAGIGLTILSFLESLVTEQNRIYFNITEVVLYILPFFGFLAVYIHHGKYGLLAYGVIIVGSYLGILYLLNGWSLSI